MLFRRFFSILGYLGDFRCGNPDMIHHNDHLLNALSQFQSAAPKEGTNFPISLFYNFLIWQQESPTNATNVTIS